ncbi:GAF and ANTAR domain-containing protein [Sinomonas mesophila]|uniref:GAF and ANTAR domain-containing protein n=1 Tax=Sinomonas mesophila TaxID=1531955 RepID=UPI00111588D0|nr:GAF and ANTAR domain-containing protein [Sinomonas mesophila]
MSEKPERSVHAEEPGIGRWNADGDSAGLMRPANGDLLDLFLDSADLAAFLARVSELAARALSAPGAEGTVHCSVTVGRENRRDTVGSSDEAAAAMDERQYASGQGPCSEAVSTQRAVYVPDLRTDRRYPRYTAALADSDLRSVFAAPIPLPASSKADAALNCYSSAVDGFPPELQGRVAELAGLVSKTIHLAVKFASEADRSSDLAAALESRTAINLAVGVIMAQSGYSQAQAIEVLKAASNHRNIKLRDVAAAVLARFDEEGPTTSFS